MPSRRPRREAGFEDYELLWVRVLRSSTEGLKSSWAYLSDHHSYLSGFWRRGVTNVNTVNAWKGLRHVVEYHSTRQFFLGEGSTFLPICCVLGVDEGLILDRVSPLLSPPCDLPDVILGLHGYFTAWSPKGVFWVNVSTEEERAEGAALVQAYLEMMR